MIDDAPENTTLRRLAGCLLIAMSCILLPSTTSAQKPSPEQIQAFEDYVKSGSELLERGEYRDAIADLERARAIIDHPRIVLTIATAYEKWGRCEQASRRYRDLLARDDSGDRIIEKARQRLDGLDTCEQRATLIVDCEPTSANVRIEGRTYACGKKLDLEVGVREVTVSAQGFATARQKVEVLAGETVRERISLRPERGVDADTSGDDIAWKRYAGFSAIGVGSALIAGGFFSDVSAVRRGQEILDAQQSADTQRVSELELQARRARTRTAILYGAGAVVAGAGVTLLLIGDDDAAESPQDKAAAFDLVLTATGADVRVRW
ncbi:MAG: PEGA domain-containing protein [Myxococcota bacterium]